MKDKGELFQPRKSQIDTYNMRWKDNAVASLATCDESLDNETKAQLFGKDTQWKCWKLVLDLEGTTSLY